MLILIVSCFLSVFLGHGSKAVLMICVKDERLKECLEYTGVIADKSAVKTREFFVEANEDGECQIVDYVKEA